jgi:hypothetical protein
MKQLFIAWVPFQRRNLSMQPYFGYELKFFSFAFKKRIFRPLEYLIKGWQTLIFLLQKQPEIIWIQLPPNFLLHLTFLYKILFNPQVKIIADCHNATFRSPWINIPGTAFLLNHSHILVIHNDSVKEQLIKYSINTQNCNLYILEDPPAKVENKILTQEKLLTHPWTLCPCSFNKDEPIKAILDAARLAPEITFIITGNTERAKGIHDLSNIPDNVKLVGFLPIDKFDSLLCYTDFILGLTTLDGIQLSVANEAVGASKPMVISNTKLLKQLFNKGAIFVDACNSQSIAQGCQKVLSNREELIEAVDELKAERTKRWLIQASQVNNALS